MGVQLKVREKPLSLVRRQNHELSRLLRTLTKESEGAVEVLVKLLSSKDEKVRKDAAKTLIDMQISVAEMINKDDITRILGEIRINGATGKMFEVDEDDTPLVDFKTIQDV